MGGDEFGILLAGLTTREAVSAVADRFLAAVSGICPPGENVVVTLSIGAWISRPTDRDRSFQAVYAKADAALRKALAGAAGAVFHLYRGNLCECTAAEKSKKTKGANQSDWSHIQYVFVVL